jgi:uncharacterized protein YggE
LIERRWVLSLAALAALALGASRNAPAQETPAPAPTDRVTVQTYARATAPADSVEVEFVVEASSSDAAEAEKTHRQKLSHLLSALTGKPEESDKTREGDDSAPKPRKRKKAPAPEDDDGAPSIDEGGAKAPLPQVGVPDADGIVYEVHEGRSTVAVQSNAGDSADDGQGEKHADGEIRVGTAIRVVFKNVAKVPSKKLQRLIASAIDRAAEAGADMGTSKGNVKPAVRFRAADPEVLKRKAYADAVAKGRARAEELARLANRTLGKLASATELDPPPLTQQQVPEGWLGFVGQVGTNDPGPDEGASASNEVAVEVRLRLEFDLR